MVEVRRAWSVFVAMLKMHEHEQCTQKRVIVEPPVNAARVVLHRPDLGGFRTSHFHLRRLSACSSARKLMVILLHVAMHLIPCYLRIDFLPAGTAKVQPENKYYITFITCNSSSKSMNDPNTPAILKRSMNTLDTTNALVVRLLSGPCTLAHISDGIKTASGYCVHMMM